MSFKTNFPMPSKIQMDESTATDNYAKFIASPFQRGFGHTVGNALRRVLLSSLDGQAISAVRIEGVSNEFSSIEGIVEDMAEIVLNLKRVKLNYIGDQPTLNAPKIFEIVKTTSGAGPVLAGDIIGGGSLEILNPDQIICTLDKDMPFRAEIEVRSGVGWLPAERNKHSGQPVNTIWVDCLFSPVTHVRYQVSPTRVGEETEMDSLVLDIYTDGRIAPKAALERAAKIMSMHLSPFLGEGPIESPDLSEHERKLLPVLKSSIDTLNLSVRAKNCLDAAGIQLIGELCLKTEASLLKCRNFGRRSLDEIIEKLAQITVDNEQLSLGKKFNNETLTEEIRKEAEIVKASEQVQKDDKKEKV